MCDVREKDGFAVGWLESVAKLLGEKDDNIDGSPVVLGCNVGDGDMTTNVTRMKRNAGQECLLQHNYVISASYKKS